MAFTANTRLVGGVTIVDLYGRLVRGEATWTCREATRDLVLKGQKQLLLNMAGVTYIDSSGIGELVSTFTWVSNQGGKLKLMNLQKKVHDLLQITKLYTVFEVHTNEAEAVRSFKL